MRAGQGHNKLIQHENCAVLLLSNKIPVEIENIQLSSGVCFFSWAAEFAADCLRPCAIQSHSIGAVKWSTGSGVF